MALPETELRLAMAWRVREISYYQRVIEASRYTAGLGEGERRRLRIFASGEIHKLNLATDEEVVSCYFSHLVSVMEAAEMAILMEENVD